MASPRDLISIPRPNWRSPQRGRVRSAAKRGRIGIADSRFVLLLGVAIGLVYINVPWPRAEPRTGASAVFGLCDSDWSSDCVIDGDTFRMAGASIRIADIDAPETHPSRCAKEARLGERATIRMQAMLNEGPFELETVDRDTDRYGRKLRVVTRDGASLGDMLVAEGVARTWTGQREPWC